jgi:hypothetical protein
MRKLPDINLLRRVELTSQQGFTLAGPKRMAVDEDGKNAILMSR